MFSIGKVINEQFTIERKLGRGAYSSVWLVSDTNGKKNALKASNIGTDLDRELYCQREVQILQKATNDEKFYYPTYVDSFNIDGFHFIVMSAEGEDIRSVRSKNSSCKFSVDNAMKLFHCLTKGLQYLHRIGFCHRDLHESNVLVTGSPDSGPFVKIADFGMSIKCVDDKGNPIVPSPGLFNFDYARHQSLEVNKRMKDPSPIDDYVALSYMVMAFHGCSLIEGPLWEVFQKKEQFYEDPDTILKTMTHLTGPMDVINKGRKEGSLDAALLLESIESTSDVSTPITHQYTSSGIMID